MRLPEYLRLHTGENITIRTNCGSQEIYVGPVEGVNYDEINRYCESKLESSFFHAEVRYRYSSPRGKDTAYRMLQSSLTRYKDFIPVQLRPIVNIERSELCPSYTFVTITGTEGGIPFNPKIESREMDTEGALRLAAGIFKDAKYELLGYWRTPPKDEYLIKKTEDWILNNVLALPINGEYMLSQTRSIYETEKLEQYSVKGTAVPRKWRDLMNKVILMGRLTQEPDLRQSQGGNSYVRFTLAVNRRGKDETDFISCALFGQRAEALAKYVTKGQRILVCGHINVDSYDDNGQRRYNTTVIIDDWEFCEKKQDTEARQPSGSTPAPQDNRRERDTGQRPARTERRQRQQRERDYYDDEPGFY